MKTFRPLAGVLLVLSGILHLYLYFQQAENSESPGLLVFGVLYSITGLLLFGSKKYPLYLGMIVPFIGMTLSFIRFGVPEIFSLLALFKLPGAGAMVCCGLALWKVQKKLTLEKEKK